MQKIVILTLVLLLGNVADAKFAMFQPMYKTSQKAGQSFGSSLSSVVQKGPAAIKNVFQKTSVKGAALSGMASQQPWNLYGAAKAPNSLNKEISQVCSGGDCGPMNSFGINTQQSMGFETKIQNAQANLQNNIQLNAANIENKVQLNAQQGIQNNAAGLQNNIQQNAQGLQNGLNNVQANIQPNLNAVQQPAGIINQQAAAINQPAQALNQHAPLSINQLISSTSKQPLSKLLWASLLSQTTRPSREQPQTSRITSRPKTFKVTSTLSSMPKPTIWLAGIAKSNLNKLNRFKLTVLSTRLTIRLLTRVSSTNHFNKLNLLTLPLSKQLNRSLSTNQWVSFTEDIG